MKTKKESNTPVIRNKYTAQYREQALERADRDGIPKTAQDLGLTESMLYSWRVIKTYFSLFQTHLSILHSTHKCNGILFVEIT